jgi:hypothetical protein
MPGRMSRRQQYILTRFGGTPKRTIRFRLRRRSPRSLLSSARTSASSLWVTANRSSSMGFIPRVAETTPGTAISIVELLVTNFGYRREDAPRKSGTGADPGAGFEWTLAPENLIDHDRLAAEAVALFEPRLVTSMRRLNGWP